MSCVFVVVPVVAGTWPIVSAAVIAACAGLGYGSVRRYEQDLELDVVATGPGTSLPHAASITASTAIISGRFIGLRKRRC